MTSEERDGATEVAELDEPSDDGPPSGGPSSGGPSDGEPSGDEPGGAADDGDTSDREDDGADAAPARRRDHPTFESLAGFYTGLVYLLLVPAGGSALLTALLGYRRATPLFPFLLLALVVPIALLVPERTRRFARYMLLGVVLTAVVVLGVAAIVLWILISLEG